MKIIKTEEIEGYTINTYDNGVIEKYISGSKTKIEPQVPEAQPTNADILNEVKKSQAEIIDNYTLELIERGVL